MSMRRLATTGFTPPDGIGQVPRWEMLAAPRIGGADGTVLHPDLALLRADRGVALLDVAPKCTPGAARGLRAMLVLQGLGRAEAERLPIAYLSIERDELPLLPHLLDAALDSRPRPAPVPPAEWLPRARAALTGLAPPRPAEVVAPEPAIPGPPPQLAAQGLTVPMVGLALATAAVAAVLAFGVVGPRTPVPGAALAPVPVPSPLVPSLSAALAAPVPPPVLAPLPPGPVVPPLLPSAPPGPVAAPTASPVIATPDQPHPAPIPGSPPMPVQAAALPIVAPPPAILAVALFPPSGEAQPAAAPAPATLALAPVPLPREAQPTAAPPPAVLAVAPVLPSREAQPTAGPAPAALALAPVPPPRQAPPSAAPAARRETPPAVPRAALRETPPPALRTAPREVLPPAAGAAPRGRGDPAPSWQPATSQCAPLLARLQLGGRPTDAERRVLATACAPRR